MTLANQMETKMTTEEGYRVSDLIFAARQVLACFENGDDLDKESQEVVWLRKTAEAARKLLPEKDA
jgi:hypothetical protein